MIHHKFLMVDDLPDRIDLNKIYVVLDGEIPTSDTVTIDVTPSDMDWTMAKIDTGDGTDWFNVTPGSGTGDDTLTVSAMSDNETGGERAGEIEISDDASEATTRVITVTQMIAPA